MRTLYVVCLLMWLTFIRLKQPIYDTNQHDCISVAAPTPKWTFVSTVRTPSLRSLLSVSQNLRKYENRKLQEISIVHLTFYICSLLFTFNHFPQCRASEQQLKQRLKGWTWQTSFSVMKEKTDTQDCTWAKKNNMLQSSGKSIWKNILHGDMLHQVWTIETQTRLIRAKAYEEVRQEVEEASGLLQSRRSLVWRVELLHSLIWHSALWQTFMLTCPNHSRVLHTHTHAATWRKPAWSLVNDLI